MAAAPPVREAGDGLRSMGFPNVALARRPPPTAFSECRSKELGGAAAAHPLADRVPPNEARSMGGGGGGGGGLDISFFFRNGLNRVALALRMVLKIFVLARRPLLL